MGETEEKPIRFPLPDGRCEWLFKVLAIFWCK